MTALADRTTSSDHALDVAAMVVARVPGRPLEQAFYTSRQIFELDLEAVFGTSWIFVANEAEIREPGDFITVTIGTNSVIVVRDDDEEVRAFHNVCRHRGARLLTEPAGSVGNIVCSYHKWTYATDGALRHAGQQPASFDRSCLGLKSVHVRSVGGLIHICLAAEPPADFDDVAAVLEPYLLPHQLRTAKVAAQEELVVDGNWKLVMENNRECYHCDGHPELSCSLFPTYGYDESDMPPLLRPAFDRYLQADADLQRTCTELGLPFARVQELERASGFRVQREPLDGAGESFSADGTVLCRKPLGELPNPRLGRLSMHHQPTTWIHVLSDHAVTFSALPLGPGQTVIKTTWLVHEDAVDGVDYDVEALTDTWRQTNLQDAGFINRAQLGVSSPAYEPGPYMPSEYQVESFVNWYLNRLREQVIA